MRRRWAALVALLLCLMVVGGCAAQAPAAAAQVESAPAESAQSQTTADAAPEPQEETEVVEEEIISYVVTDDLYEKEYTREDGTVYAALSCHIPVLEPECISFSVVMEERRNSIVADWEESYLPDLQQIDQQQLQYSGDFDYTCTINGDLLSLRFADTLDLGGAHPVTTFSALAFDLQQERFVSVADLAEDREGLRDVVAKEILRQMEQSEVPEQYFIFYSREEMPQILASWVMDCCVYMGAEQMEITYNVYTLAPYAAGPLTFSVPYDMLSPYLSQYGADLLQLAS